jgi:hypothetical protein
MFATLTQELQHVRALLRSQDETGIVPAPTANEDSTPDEKRAALLAGTYRPPCGCDPANSPVPCDAAVLSIISPEPPTGCPNVSRNSQG